MPQSGFRSMDLHKCSESNGDSSGLFENDSEVAHPVGKEIDDISYGGELFHQCQSENSKFVSPQKEPVVLLQPTIAYKQESGPSTPVIDEWQPKDQLTTSIIPSDVNFNVNNPPVYEKEVSSTGVEDNWFPGSKEHQGQTVASGNGFLGNKEDHDQTVVLGSWCTGDREDKEQTVEHRSSWLSPKRRWLMHQVLVAIAVSMGSFLIGFTSAFTSPALESMKDADSAISVTKSQEAWIGGLMPFSAIIGALLSGLSIEKLGRRITVSGTALPFLVSYILIAAASHVYTIYLARVVAGVAVGMLSLVMPVYLGETVHASVRGTLGLFPTTIGNSGILVCFLFGSYLRWNMLALSAIAYPIIFATLMWFTPESPHWYIARGRKEEAQTSLQWLRGGSKITARIAEETASELADLHAHVIKTREQQISFLTVLQRKHLQPLLMSLTLMYFQQMSGINAVIFYSNSIFRTSGSNIDSNLSSVIIALVNLVATLLANYLIDRVGRKKLLYISSVTMAITLLLLGGYFYLHSLGPSGEAAVSSLGFMPLMCLVMFMLAFSLGWGPIPWLFLGEGLPSQTRGMIGSIAATFNWACAFAVTQSFNSLVNILGTHSVFWIFSGNVIVSSLVVYFFLPETKGRTLEDIEYNLQQKPAGTDDPENVAD